MRRKRSLSTCVIVALAVAGLFGCGSIGGAADQPPQVRPGSKAFTESGILGEMLTLLARIAGADAVPRHGLSGTQIAWGALVSGEIDCYVDYTGTIRKEMLPGRTLPTEDALRAALAEQGIRMSRPLGFANTYALGMKKATAERLGIRRISDLKQHPRLQLGFTAEFLDRADGWPGLRAHYQLPQTNVKGMEHALAYESLETGSLDVTDLYSTDAKIRTHDLQVLTDDRHYFPNYDAVLLYRADLEERAPQVVTALRQLEGRLSERDMVELNSRVELDRVSETEAAADFLTRLGLLRPEHQMYVQVETIAARLWRLTKQHLLLVSISLLAAIVVAVPLGVLAAYRPTIGQIILTGAGVLQTIPSLALLVFMIPLLGIGPLPAIAALFLYSLLPIVRNTHAGLTDIPLPLRESAEALGLPGFARLWLIELPMAARTILAGIKTAAVINVGTATLGGFIGAGGYGQLINTGLYKADKGLILQGAIPAALLALLVQGLFELAERWLVPRGLRLRPAGAD